MNDKETSSKVKKEVSKDVKLKMKQLGNLLKASENNEEIDLDQFDPDKRKRSSESSEKNRKASDASSKSSSSSNGSPPTTGVAETSNAIKAEVEEKLAEEVKPDARPTAAATNIVAPPDELESPAPPGNIMSQTFAPSSIASSELSLSLLEPEVAQIPIIDPKKGLRQLRKENAATEQTKVDELKRRQEKHKLIQLYEKRMGYVEAPKIVQVLKTSMRFVPGENQIPNVNGNPDDPPYLFKEAGRPILFRIESIHDLEAKASKEKESTEKEEKTYSPAFGLAWPVNCTSILKKAHQNMLEAFLNYYANKAEAEGSGVMEGTTLYDPTLSVSCAISCGKSPFPKLLSNGMRLTADLGGMPYTPIPIPNVQSILSRKSVRNFTPVGFIPKDEIMLDELTEDMIAVQVPLFPDLGVTDMGIPPGTRAGFMDAYGTFYEAKTGDALPVDATIGYLDSEGLYHQVIDVESGMQNGEVIYKEGYGVRQQVQPEQPFINELEQIYFGKQMEEQVQQEQGVEQGQGIEQGQGVGVEQGLPGPPGTTGTSKAGKVIRPGQIKKLEGGEVRSARPVPKETPSLANFNLFGASHKLPGDISQHQSQAVFVGVGERKAYSVEQNHEVEPRIKKRRKKKKKRTHTRYFVDDNGEEEEEEITEELSDYSIMTDFDNYDIDEDYEAGEDEEYNDLELLEEAEKRHSLEEKEKRLSLDGKEKRLSLDEKEKRLSLEEKKKRLSLEGKRISLEGKEKRLSLEEKGKRHSLEPTSQVSPQSQPPKPRVSTEPPGSEEAPSTALATKEVPKVKQYVEDPNEIVRVEIHDENNLDEKGQPTVTVVLRHRGSANKMAEEGGKAWIEGNEKVTEVPYFDDKDLDENDKPKEKKMIVRTRLSEIEKQVSALTGTGPKECKVSGQGGSVGPLQSGAPDRENRYAEEEEAKGNLRGALLTKDEVMKGEHAEEVVAVQVPVFPDLGAKDIGIPVGTKAGFMDNGTFHEAKAGDALPVEATLGYLDSEGLYHQVLEVESGMKNGELSSEERYEVVQKVEPGQEETRRSQGPTSQVPREGQPPKPQGSKVTTGMEQGSPAAPKKKEVPKTTEVSKTTEVPKPRQYKEDPNEIVEVEIHDENNLDENGQPTVKVVLRHRGSVAAPKEAREIPGGGRVWIEGNEEVTELPYFDDKDLDEDGKPKQKRMRVRTRLDDMAKQASTTATGGGTTRKLGRQQRGSVGPPQPGDPNYESYYAEEEEQNLRDAPLTKEERERLIEFQKNISVQCELDFIEGSLDLGEVVRKSFRIYSHGGSIDIEPTIVHEEVVHQADMETAMSPNDMPAENKEGGTGAEEDEEEEEHEEIEKSETTNKNKNDNPKKSYPGPH